jgi:hypothetical protein
MLPRELQPEQFGSYPPEARKLAVAHVGALRQLPISFLPSLLRELIDYDFKFPVEQKAIEEELTNLTSLTPAQINDWFHSFERLSVSTKLEQLDWINQPAQFTEQLSAYLWSTHQLDTFRQAATDYGERLHSALPSEPLPTRRLGIAVIGQAVPSYDGTLFKNLRQHGTYFDQIKPDSGLETLIAAAEARAKRYDVPYGHWYVDGGEPAAHSQLLTSVSYKALEPVRNALLKNMQAQIGRPGMGPEELRTHMAKLVPADLGMGKGGDPRLDRFQLKVLTEGSGTQIFSTTFAQWTTREVLRRAQALTLVVRFAPRQKQRPMNELLTTKNDHPELDPEGSLVDADMASYYHWINQQRLPGDRDASFLVWFEGHNQALVVSPRLPRGTTSSSALGLGELLNLVTT